MHTPSLSREHGIFHLCHVRQTNIQNNVHGDKLVQVGAAQISALPITMQSVWLCSAALPAHICAACGIANVFLLREEVEES